MRTETMNEPPSQHIERRAFVGSRGAEESGAVATDTAVAVGVFKRAVTPCRNALHTPPK